ncbi:hypothetical protein D915_000108 [Fasciola hepatica]|uniref:Uncharacterized protein n=1 Tax=Fasciola hepatica TaxID=6192 RepID=A0A4E0S0M8_FASHE|nr:hypothetical protein D915_000108 [Fasciola hepatica]
MPEGNAPLITSTVPSVGMVFTGTTALMNQSTNLREGWLYEDPGRSLYTTNTNDTSIP